MRNAIDPGRSIDLLRAHNVMLALSALLVLAALAVILTRGLNFGLDFTGGLLLEAAFPEPVTSETVRLQLQASGNEGALVQNFGSANQMLIRLPASSDATVEQELLLSSLRLAFPGIEFLRLELVGPQVGAELAEQGGLALLIALLLILAYVSVRFQWKLALGAVVALAHDVIVTVGFFSLFRFTFDLAVLAGLLAVIGYSLNDTIVIFDRARENFLRLRREPPKQVLSISLNQTLSRTLVTSLTTLLVLVALLAVGGEALRGFAIAMVLGVTVGTYSSIYVASAVALALGLKSKDLLPIEEKVAELDDLP